MLKRFIKITWLLAVSALFLAAVLLTAARVLVPMLADYRNDIEQAATDMLGRSVDIRRMEATWRGLHPVLKLRNITIASGEANTPLYVDEIWLRVDIAHYLRHRAVRLAGLDIIGTDLDIIRDENGRFYVQQLQGIGRGDGQGAGILMLMDQLSLHESNITFTDRQAGRAPQRFSSVMLSLNNTGDVRRLTGHAWLPGEFGYRIELNAGFTGNDPDFMTWKGRVYVTGQQLSLPSLLQYWQTRPETRGLVNLRLWIDIDAGHVETVSSELDMREVYIARRTDTDMQVFSADVLGLRVGWQGTADDWRAVVHVLAVDQAPRQWAPFSITLTGGRRMSLDFVRVNAAQLALDDLWQVLPAVPGLDIVHFNELSGANLTGHLDDVDVLLLRNGQGLRLANIDARFSEIGMAETAYTPYLSGLDGVITGSGDAGTLLFESGEVDVTDSRLFRDILNIGELAGEVHWQRDAQNLFVHSSRLTLLNADLALLADFGLTLPREEGAARLVLQVDIERADLARISRYLPAQRMSPRAVTWLDRSLLAGEVREGSVRIDGQLDQIPFDQGEGVLEARLPVHDATLDFNPDWTPIRELDAQVNFNGRSMHITSRRGMIRSARLQQVHARIADLASPFLTIDGEVNGELPVMLAELGSSPLGKRFGGFVDRTSTSGACGLQLDIAIPLKTVNREVTVAGQISLQGNTLQLRDSDIELTGITGMLAFDADGIAGEGLRAELFGRPATARVWSEPGKPGTYIQLDGRLDLFGAVLAGDSPLRKAFSGGSDWQVRLDIRGQPARGARADIGLTVTSSLAGTGITLPAPLGKGIDEARPLSITVKNVAADRRRTRFRYGDQVQGVLLLDSRNPQAPLQRGTVTIGGNTAELTDKPGLTVNGRLLSLPLQQWQHWLAGERDGTAVPLNLNLQIDELEVMGYQLDDLRLTAANQGRAWNIKVAGGNSRGEVEVIGARHGFEKLVMNLERLVVSKSPREQSAGPTMAAPGDLPEIQVMAHELVVDGNGLGQLDIKAAPVADNYYVVERLALSSDLLSLRLDGSWHMTGQNHVSRINLEVSKGAMGELLDIFGFEQTIKDGSLTGNMQASWPAPLLDYELDALDGTLYVLIKDGQLLDVEPGASGRALGLLSIGSLPKRLTLDFSDFFGEGFRFERIAGNFVLVNGNAYTNDLEVDGRAAKIDIAGRVGLIDQDYDKLITVTPYLEASLPLAGALAGGPAVGAAVIVAEKVLGGTLGLNEMARKQYTVTGPWDAPRVTRIDAPQEPADSEPDFIYE